MTATTQGTRSLPRPGVYEIDPAYPEGTVATPHLFRKVAVPGVRVA